MTTPKMIVIKKNELLSFIKKYLPHAPAIVEAGAFDGSDTKKIKEFWPQSTIHSFEPVPEIFALLEKNTTHIAGINRYSMALSNKTGSAIFHVSEKPSRPNQPFQAGSLHEPDQRLLFSDARYPQTISVPTITLDDWAAAYAIDAIDFLWLDAQGHELAILQGATNILKTVTVLYTEVNFIHAYKDQPLYDEIKSWIESQGFVLIAQDFIDQSTWFFGNALFVKKN